MMHTVPDDKIPLLKSEYAAANFERLKNPPRQKDVFVLARDWRGEYQIPFPVVFTENDVLNAQSREPLANDVAIVAWRYP